MGDEHHAHQPVETSPTPSLPPAYLHPLIAGYGPVDALAHPADRPEAHGGLLAQVQAIAVQATRVGARVVIPEDDEWPTTLADLAATPVEQAQAAALCLWVRGDRSLSDALRRAVAVVGARAATEYGNHVAQQLGYDLADAGWTVVATAGYGIATAALRGALAGDGATVAVLPAGIDRPYPAGNAELFDRVAKKGLLVSLWPPGTAATRERLAAAGGLVAALSGGTVLVEAAKRSAALGVLEQAIDLGRPAMVVPGPVTSTMSAGAHGALRQHRCARLVRDAADVIAELTPSPEPTR